MFLKTRITMNFKAFLFLIDIFIYLDFTALWHKKIARVGINLI